MKTNTQVYGVGVNPTPIPQVIIDERLTILNKRLGTILTVPYLERDEELVRQIQGHIRFWQNINSM